MIGGFIHNVLKANFNINRDVAGRIYPMVIPEGDSLPAIVYQLINTSPVKNKYTRPKLDERLVQISCYGDSYDDAVRVMRSVRAVLERYEGTAENVVVQLCSFMGERDTFSEGGEKVGIQQDYKFRISNRFDYSVKEYDDRGHQV